VAVADLTLPQPVVMVVEVLAGYKIQTPQPMEPQTQVVVVAVLAAQKLLVLVAKEL
jgi:hypothetical protein